VKDFKRTAHFVLDYKVRVHFVKDFNSTGYFEPNAKGIANFITQERLIGGRLEKTAY
jgi:hypothetical protein